MLTEGLEACRRVVVGRLRLRCVGGALTPRLREVLPIDRTLFEVEGLEACVRVLVADSVCGRVLDGRLAFDLELEF